MCETYQKEQIKINVMYDNALKNGRYYSNNSEHLLDSPISKMFYLDNINNKDTYFNFFNINESSKNEKNIKLDIAKTNEYLNNVNDCLKQYSNKFVEFVEPKMNILKELETTDLLISINIIINEKDINLTFIEENHTNTLFLSLLFSNITDIVFINNYNEILVFPKLNSNYLKLFIDDVKFTAKDLEKELANLVSNHSSDGYRLFGMIYGNTSKNNNLNISSKEFLVSAKVYNDSIKDSYTAEINKGISLSKLVSNIEQQNFNFNLNFNSNERVALENFNNDTSFVTRDFLTVYEWKEFLIQDKKDYPETYDMLMLILKDGKMTCTNLSQKYGNTKNYYNNMGWQLGKRVSKYFNMPKQLNSNGEERFWTIPFLGGEVNQNEMPGSFWWELKPNLKQALNNLNRMEQLLPNFKQLLHIFVNQLNINNNLIEGKHTSGQGYLGENKTRKMYINYRDYGEFTIDFSIQTGGYRNTSGGVNYIHITNTSIDIRPVFNKETKEIECFIISKDKTYYDKKYMSDDLDLDSNNAPNNKLKELFEDYILEFYKYENENNINNDNINDDVNEEETANNKFLYDFNQPSITDAKNLIVYGTPGCGKSYYVDNTLLKDYKENDIKYFIRTTFYQDYSNTDFVGQIVPVVKEDKTVTYKFNPGPFTIALNMAIQNPNRHVALVIEELNRGNAPSIFGDIFQLLDRNNGVSQYEITNINIQKYLEEQNLNYKFEYIKLPGNFNIFATMNTSDQNVFTLDTAFKRRWQFEKIKNNFNEHKFKTWLLPGANISWENFCIAINNAILNDESFINSEDKQLGVYFIDQNLLREKEFNISSEDNIKKFAFKIFEYLWDDVAKFNRENWFKENIKSLDQLIDEYIEKGNENKGLEVFKDDIFNSK